LTPFSERGRAVLFEVIAAVEVAILVEVIVDGGMDGGEFLPGLYISELRHRCFSSPERLVGILGPIVEPLATGLRRSMTDHIHRMQRLPFLL
jgi:hypothetical protein